jgi:hypothetical protein
MIAIGGVFIIFGWGVKAEEWARGLGWLLTGLGFACEMVYGQLSKAARNADRNEAQDDDRNGAQNTARNTAQNTATAEEEQPRASDETAPDQRM